jgi:hypothetical protein
VETHAQSTERRVSHLTSPAKITAIPRISIPYFMRFKRPYEISRVRTVAQSPFSAEFSLSAERRPSLNVRNGSKADHR